MADRKKFFDRVGERFEDLDASSRQAFLTRLSRERGFFETIFTAIDDGIVVIDRELKLRYWNRAAQELLALPENAGELRLSQLLPDLDWPRLIPPPGTPWQRVARQEFELLYPQPRFLQLYLAPLGSEPENAAVILHDVTEQRRRASTELERETVKAVSQLAAGVAHEIGNPLNSLYLNLQILEKGIGGDDALPESESADMIRICKNEVERLDSIIHSFLSAIRPGKTHFAPVDLRQLVVEVLNFMRPEIEARHVGVKCNWSGALPPCSGDAEQLKQVFYNIIRNAVQAMSNGGGLEIFGYAEHDFLVLEFADSGRGMDAEKLREMFIPFKTNRAGGSGIGTMIIERICREHGASIGVVSTEGRGTVFQLKFPLGNRRMRLLSESSN